MLKEGRVKHRFYFHYGYMRNKEYDWDFSGITGFQAQAALKSDENQKHWLIVSVPLTKLIDDAPGPLMFEIVVRFEEGKRLIPVCITYLNSTVKKHRLL